MLSAGEVLRQKRLELKLTFTQLTETTKIPDHTLKALEKSQFDELPAFPFLKGVAQNYAKELQLDPVKIVAILKRDYDRQQHKNLMPTGLNKALGQEPLGSFLERPLTLFAAGIILLVGLVTWSLIRIYQPPPLNIVTPLDGQTAVSPVNITGRTDRDASLTLNGNTVNLEPDGNFKLEYPAEPGKLELNFKAVSRRQKTSQKTVTVVVVQ